MPHSSYELSNTDCDVAAPLSQPLDIVESQATIPANKLGGAHPLKHYNPKWIHPLFDVTKKQSSVRLGATVADKSAGLMHHTTSRRQEARHWMPL